MKQLLRFRGYYCPNSKRPLTHKTIFVSLFLASIIGYVQGQPSSATRLNGTVLSAETGQPLEGASIKVTGRGGALPKTPDTQTDAEGTFALYTSLTDGIIQVSYIGYWTQTIQFGPTATSPFTITLEKDENMLEEVEVNTGYQTIAKERATGSFVSIDNTLLNRNISPNIIERLEGVASGVIFNRQVQTGENESPFSIRGRSTLFANTRPLIILDNFPYEGSIDNINPNSVEQITILKDAAAASIWGARSGNGVIVITTKKGTADQQPAINFMSSVNIAGRPDLFYRPQMSNKDYIAVERFLFDKGFYNSLINARPRRSLSDAVEIMLQERDGVVSPAEAAAGLDALARHDIRRELEANVYRAAVTQQYDLDVSGGGKVMRYFFSAGYNHGRENHAGNSSRRISLQNKNTYLLAAEKVELTTDISMVLRATERAFHIGTAMATWPYPYARLRDDNGHAAAIPGTYSHSYTDTAGQGLLLDWRYRPLEEIHQRGNDAGTREYRIASTLKYRIAHGLEADVLYQYYQGSEDADAYYTAESYYTRNLINRFTQLDYSNHRIQAKPVPEGDILDRDHGGYAANNLRTQLSYQAQLGSRHQLVALAGAEVSAFRRSSGGYRLYGYDPRNETSVVVDVVNSYPTHPNGTLSRIDAYLTKRTTVDRYISYYGNMAYTYLSRYTFSASARKDASNLFGVDANQRGVPLWSLGLGWDISREGFYGLDAIPSLRLRVTTGYNGNVDKTVSAYTTAQAGARSNRYGANFYQVRNPPNAELRWEKIRMTNLALDFSLKKAVISGSVEYFVKQGKDLIGDAPLPPSAGLTRYRGNHANLVTKGFDIMLNSIQLRGAFRWTSDLLFSMAKDRVTQYMGKPVGLTSYVQQDFTYPYEGRPFNSVFAFRWAGLDPQSGAPVGYINGETSMDYTNLVNITSVDDMPYYGPGRPVYFGGVRNNLSYKNFGLSFNITGKLGYYLKEPALSYRTLLQATGGNPVQPGFADRWQQPGDEHRTHVPALYYPANANRETFYQHAEVHVKRGDHFRLQDVRLDYTPPVVGKSVFRSLSFFLYASNLGIVWKDIDGYLDPDYFSMPPSASVALGFRAGF